MVRTLIVTVGGLGLLRPASGTWGSLPPCLFALACVLLAIENTWYVTGLIIITLVSCIGCVALGNWCEERFQGKDPGQVVIDEVAGMALTLIGVPLYPFGNTSVASACVVIGAAFVLFRILDIVKVPPANVMQQFPAGWGILLDDLVVAVYANIMLQVILRVLPMLS